MTTYRLLIAFVVAISCLACTREPEVTETTSVGSPPAETTTLPVSDTAIVTPSEVRSLGWGAWHDWDVDANKLVKRDEFDRRFTTVYTGWAGADNTMAADEAADTWRDWFDGNNDNIIDSEEWNRATTNWKLKDYNWGEQTAWDTDRDNRITETEWNSGFRNVRANATWSRDELADTWWDWWDGNDDNIIDENEWNSRAPYWRDNA